LISKGARYFGSQCIVVAIDAKRVPESQPLSWKVFSHGGSRSTGRDAVAWAQEVAERGAGEILLTSMDADGHKAGFDLELTASISSTLRIPVIASGGGGTLGHFRDALTLGQADAVLAASVFHYGTYTVSEVKRFLHGQDIPVRLT
jgi:cyclase